MLLYSIHEIPLSIQTDNAMMLLKYSIMHYLTEHYASPRACEAIESQSELGIKTDSEVPFPKIFYTEQKN